jgi:hypothetical protein
MQKAIDAFHESLSRVEYLGGLHLALTSLTTPIIDASDILRAQIVLVVSAFDYYIHEITALGMVEVFNGTRKQTPAFLKFRVSIGAFKSGASDWFEAEVRERHSFLSFQQPDKVADAVRLFSEITLWQELSKKMGKADQDIKDELTLIVDRRNKIAHEADLDPSYPSVRWPIQPGDVSKALNFIRTLGESIHSVAAPL